MSVDHVCLMRDSALKHTATAYNLTTERQYISKREKNLSRQFYKDTQRADKPMKSCSRLSTGKTLIKTTVRLTPTHKDGSCLFAQHMAVSVQN